MSDMVKIVLRVKWWRHPIKWWRDRKSARAAEAFLNWQLRGRR